MDSEPQSPAGARLERAIAALETALRDRHDTPADAAGDFALQQRHDALKATVAACIGEIDTIIADVGRGSGDNA